MLAYAWCRASRSVAERSLAILLTAAWCGVAGLARVRLGAHWPSDMIAGALIGVLWLATVLLALSRGERV